MAEEVVKPPYIYDKEQMALRPATDAEIAKEPERLETIYEDRPVVGPQENIPPEKGTTTFGEARRTAGQTGQGPAPTKEVPSGVGLVQPTNKPAPTPNTSPGTLSSKDVKK